MAKPKDECQSCSSKKYESSEFYCYEHLLCLICTKKPLDEEFEYEDYYTLFRGHLTSDGAIEGFICFDCMEEAKFKRGRAGRKK